MDRNQMMIIAAAIALVLVLGGILLSNRSGTPSVPTPPATEKQPQSWIKQAPHNIKKPA